MRTIKQTETMGINKTNSWRDKNNAKIYSHKDPALIFLVAENEKFIVDYALSPTPKLQHTFGRCYDMDGST